MSAENHQPDNVLKTCRICLDDQSDVKTGRLFSPCLCKGSAIHESCLAEWRTTHQGGPAAENFFRCEVCLYAYRTSRQRWARLLLHPAVVCTSTLLLVGTTTWVVSDGWRRAYALSGAMEPMPRFNSLWYSILTLGAVSLLRTSSSSGNTLRRWLSETLANSSRQQRNSDDYKGVLLIAAVGGFAVAVADIYRGFSSMTRNQLARISDRVLEVQPL